MNKKIKYNLEETRDWFLRQIQTAPRPLPAGRLPGILANGEKEGHGRGNLLEVLDAWLNSGYLTILDQISNDAVLTDAGQAFFYLN